MNRLDALLHFFEFMVDYHELNPRGRKYHTFNGSALCEKCKNKINEHKKSKLYMQIGITDDNVDTPIFLKCFRASCGLARVINRDDFELLGYENEENIKLLLSYNSNSTFKKIKVNRSGFGNLKKLPYNKMILDNHRNQIDYLIKRTKINFKNIINLYKYRIILDFNAFIELNNLKIDKLKFKNLDTIAFITDDGNMVQLRGIDSSFKQKLTIDDSVKSHGYELYSDKDIDEVESLVISEGIFDIINVKSMLRDMKKTKFVASLGFDAIVDIINYNMNKYCDTLKRLVIVMDSDTEVNGVFKFNIDQIIKLKRHLKNKINISMFTDIIFVYNTKSKDFGDFRNPIEYKIEKLK